MKFKIWLGAARLRTLPLSLSGIITGTALANFSDKKDPIIFGLCLLVTIGFQVTSNFANDYGDGVKGTDGEDRIGPKRALQSGALTPEELKRGIISTSIISLVLVVILLYRVFGWNNLPYFAIFLFLGGISIWAAIKYTVGDSAYGYRGLGDVFVFLFFGLLAVLGTKFLYTRTLMIVDVLPAVAIGLLCAGVLNLNNLRDIRSDSNHGKNTLVVKMGFLNGKRYHFFLLLLSFATILSFCFFSGFSMLTILIVITPFLFIAMHGIKVLKTKYPADLDPELKK